MMSKELNAFEALQMEPGDKFTVIHPDGCINGYKAVLALDFDNKLLKWENGDRLYFTEENLNSKFIPEPKPVSFMEAVESKKLIKVDVSDFDNISSEDKEILNTYTSLDDVLRILSCKFYNETIRKIITLDKWYIKW